MTESALHPYYRHIRLANGDVAELLLDPHGIHRLVVETSVERDGEYDGKTQYSLVVTGDDLRRIAASVVGVESCGNCKYGRIDANSVTRCHLRPPKKRGDETFFPRMNTTDWCGKYRPIPAPTPIRTEPREVAA